MAAREGALASSACGSLRDVDARMTRDGRWLSCGPLARDAARAAAAKLDTLPSVATSLSRRCARVCKRCRYVVHRSSAVLAERRVPSLGVDGACMLFDRLTSEFMALRGAQGWRDAQLPRDESCRRVDARRAGALLHCHIGRHAHTRNYIAR